MNHIGTDIFPCSDTFFPQALRRGCLLWSATHTSRFRNKRQRAIQPVVLRMSSLLKISCPLSRYIFRTEGPSDVFTYVPLFISHALIYFAKHKAALMMHCDNSASFFSAWHWLLSHIHTNKQETRDDDLPEDCSPLLDDATIGVPDLAAHGNVKKMKKEEHSEDVEASVSAVLMRRIMCHSRPLMRSLVAAFLLLGCIVWMAIEVCTCLCLSVCRLYVCIEEVISVYR